VATSGCQAFPDAVRCFDFDSVATVDEGAELEPGAIRPQFGTVAVSGTKSAMFLASARAQGALKAARGGFRAGCDGNTEGQTMSFSLRVDNTGDAPITVATALVSSLIRFRVQVRCQQQQCAVTAGWLSDIVDTQAPSSDVVTFPQATFITMSVSQYGPKNAPVARVAVGTKTLEFPSPSKTNRQSCAFVAGLDVANSDSQLVYLDDVWFK